jgi:P2 family phage contractile tail tube protein
MAAADHILKNFNLFIEGFGYAGNIDELQLPALKLKAEDHRAGGMDAPIKIDLGMEALETTFSLTKLDSLAQSMLGQTLKKISLTFRGATQDDNGTVHQTVVKCTGKCTSYEPDAWKAGEIPKYKYTIACSYYHHANDGFPVHIIDVVNCIRIIGGIDQLSGMRDAIGLNQGIVPTLRNVIGI